MLMMCVFFLQKVLNDNKQNTVISPFLIKLLLAILAEMAGQGSGTHREVLSILPGIQTENDLRELYAKPFVSLLVSIKFSFILFFCAQIILNQWKISTLQQNSTDYELDLGAELFIDKNIAARQKFVSIVKSFYNSGIYLLR